MSDAPLFVQIHGSPLYALETVETPPGWVAFVYAGGGDTPASIGIPSSAGLGHYVFAPDTPVLPDTATAARFANAIVTWVAATFGDANACVWLPDSAGPQFGAPGQTAIAFSVGGGGGFQTASNFNCIIGQLTLSVPQGVSLLTDDRGLRFLRTGSSARVQFATRDDIGIPTVDDDATLPFVGPLAGTIGTSGTLPRTDKDSTLTYFETGFHYLHGDGTGGVEARQIHPLLKSGAALAPLAYAGFVDPLDPVNSVTPLSAPSEGRCRTLFVLKDRAASWYADVLGRPLDLVPLNGLDSNGTPQPFAGALVPQYKTPAGTANPGAIYLTPAGEFALVAAAGGTTLLDVPPGLFGSETIQLRGYDLTGAFDRLRFQPGQPAYAPVFPFVPSNLAAPSADASKPKMTSLYQTSWVAVRNGPAGATAYLAQPEGASLYAPDASMPVMAPLKTPSAIPQPPTALLLPLAPYGGLATGATFASTLIGAFESQVLAAERKRLLGAITTPRIAASKRRLRLMTDPPAIQASTKQGLYAEIGGSAHGAASMAEDAAYDKVVLAKSVVSGSTPIDFGFRGLSAELQSLFQTNQLMAVIVDPTHLGPSTTMNHDAAGAAPGFDREVVIAGWRMTAAVGEAAPASAIGNIAILKYADGTLQDRITNPTKWIESQAFSISGPGDPAIAITALSQYLQDYIGDALKKADGGDTLYTNFAKIVRDPKWQGTLVLRAKIEPSSLPDQIKGLVAGIDFTRFEAHHFGITASRVSVDGTRVTMETPSSLFGLIDYMLPPYQRNIAAGGSPDMPIPLTTDGDFGFSVLQLQVLFENAAIKDFRSHIQLTIDTLFASVVDTAYGAIGQLPATAVVLDGSYQRQGDTAVYVFEQNAATVMALESNVLPAVSLDRIVFNTLTNGDDGSIRSRFLVWGTLEFACLTVTADDGSTKASDLLSFGLQADEPIYGAPAGLRFSGLEIALASPAETPNAVTFAMEAGKLAFDAGGSAARPSSLYKDLALEVESFIAGPQDKRPIDFGYLPIDIEPEVTVLDGPWWGIVCKVNMGSPGALVATAGFASRMLLAWGPTSQPGDTAAAVFVGLQLPGASPGAKLLSLQGVLKLTIDSLVLRRETVTEGVQAFVLRLSNIGLTFLGLIKVPSSPINFFLFGDPGGSGSIGWYAAYIEDQASLASPPAVIGYEERTS